MQSGSRARAGAWTSPARGRPGRRTASAARLRAAGGGRIAPPPATLLAALGLASAACPAALALPAAQGAAITLSARHGADFSLPVSRLAAPLPEGGWDSPLPGTLRITGTFGESRGGHLHSGIDLSTGGVTGVPVRALAAGSVVRLRAGAFGYGRALYFDVGGGTLIVYGHLQRFAPALEGFLRGAQEAAGEYEADLSIEPGRFVHAAGDTLAWSGDTGSGPAHLHLEVRRGGLPVNPLIAGLRAPDGAPPSLPALVWRALDSSGWVDGGSSATRAAPGDGGAPCAPPVRVHGLVGLECLAVDANGATDARLTPLRIGLYLDGELIFERRFHAFPFGLAGEVRRIYGPEAAGEGPFRQRLYRWPPGARPDVGDTGAGTGWIDAGALSPGRHEVRIEASDAAGRTAELRGEIEPALPDPPRPPLRPGAARAAPLRASAWVEEMLVLFELEAPEPLPEAPQAELLLAEGGALPLEPRGAGPNGGWLFAATVGDFDGLCSRLRVALPQAGDAETLALPALLGVSGRDPRASGVPPARVGSLTLSATPATFPGAAAVLVRLSTAPADTASELQAISPLVTLEPEWAPLAAPLGVFLGPDSAAVAVGWEGPWALYRRRAGGGWGLAGRECVPAGWGAEVSALGSYALMLDCRAPRIVRPSPADGAWSAARPETLRVVLEEEGAGVDVLGSDIVLDGVLLLAAYDVDRGELWAEVPARLAPGEHRWEVRAVDRAGQTARREMRFTWTPR